MARSDVRKIDPFDAPVPGQGMTGAPEQYPWERPTRTSKPEEAAMAIISKIESNPQTEEAILNLMASGIPIENLVNTIALSGFGEGEFTPDTAEMIKLPLTVYLIGAAIENKIEAQVFNKSPKDDTLVENADMEMILENRDPSRFAMYKENMREALEDSPDMIQDERNEMQELAMDEQSEGFMRPPMEELV